MSLTKQDLLAIKAIVDDKVDSSEHTTASAFTEVFKNFRIVFKKLNSLNDNLSGVKQEILSVRLELGGLQQAMGRIEMLQQMEVLRADKHDAAINALQRKTRTA